MFFDEYDAATKTKKPGQMDATGDKMLYEDAKRVATYTTGTTAIAHMSRHAGRRDRRIRSSCS